MVAAPFISPQAASICANEGIGYMDLAGNCLLSFDRVYIEQQGRPNPFSEKRDLRSLYSPKAERVLRVLLNDPKKAWRVQALATEARVSIGQMANVKSLLEDREWLTRTEAGLLIDAPAQLLAEWRANYRFSRSAARNYYTLKSVTEIEGDLAQICQRQNIRYALTGFSAAARYAPSVRYQRAMAYVEKDMDQVASLLSLKEVSSGANVTLLHPYDEGVMYASRQWDEVQIAAPIQVYLDSND